MTYKVKGLPASIRVGLHNYRVELTDNPDALGQTWPAGRIISINEYQREAHDAVDTVIHELLHACFFAFGLPEEDHKEQTVTVLGTALATVFRDNPALLSWIAKTIR